MEKTVHADLRKLGALSYTRLTARRVKIENNLAMQRSMDNAFITVYHQNLMPEAILVLMRSLDT